MSEPFVASTIRFTRRDMIDMPMSRSMDLDCFLKSHTGWSARDILGDRYEYQLRINDAATAREFYRCFIDLT